MVDHWRWHRSTRVRRWTPLTATFGLTLGLLLACALPAALPTTAFASAPEMRGEWQLSLVQGSISVKGTTLITQEANGNGEFTSNTVKYESGLTGVFSGTLEGGTATIKVTTNPSGGLEEGEFTSKTMTVNSGPSTLTLSGSGTLKFAGSTGPATLTATRVRSYTQIEEQEAQEKKEQEEREARARVRGEWSLTIESGPQSVKGTALISSEANAQNAFSSANALFESAIPGVFSGTLEGGEASVTITTQAAGPYPEGKFTGTKLTVAFTLSSMSITGSGTLELGGTSLPATLTATRTKTYQEVVTRERKEREAKEKSEKEALEAKEKEAAEKVAQEAKEKEATEKVAREAKEKQEREAREAAEKAAIAKVAPPPPPTPAPLVSVKLTGESFTVSSSGQVSFQINNPNDYTVSGHIALLLAQSSKGAKSSSKKTVSLGTASFSVSPSGKQVVKLELSQKGRSELSHHKTLHILATVTTAASGQATATKTFGLTLHAGSTHRKG